MKKYILILICVQFSQFSFAQLVVTPGGTAATIVSSLVDPVLNATNPVIFCNAAQYGKYTAAGAALGKVGSGAGIILSAGKVADAVGNNTFSASTDFGVNAADAELSTVVSQAIHDRCYVQFDILPAADTVKINYVFCSEEYYTYCYDASVYNDAFGFYLKQLPAGPYVNFATIPGTVPPKPVSVKNIHPGPACTTSGLLGSNPATNQNVSYFVDNTGPNTGVTYNGMTKPMSASIPVTRNQSYRVKVAIGDATDGILDAALFIKTVSFAIPVELLSFNAFKDGNHNSLRWSTATEKNNDHFEILRSSDGISYASIGTVKGNGNSSVLKNYEFIDHMPGQGLNYYRLRQVDYDGKANYSGIKSVTTLIRIAASPIYPNPATGPFASAKLDIPFNGKITSQVLDITGKLVQETEHEVQEGINNIEVPVETLPKGYYYVKFKGNNYESDVLKVVK